MEVRLVTLGKFFGYEGPMSLFYNPKYFNRIKDLPMWLDGHRVHFSRDSDNRIYHLTVDTRMLWVYREVCKDTINKLFIRKVDYHRIIGDPLKVNSAIPVPEIEPTQSETTKSGNTQKAIEWGLIISTGVIIGGNVIGRFAKEMKSFKK